MNELRSQEGKLAGVYGFSKSGFHFEYKSKDTYYVLFLQLFPKIKKPIVTIRSAK